MLLGFMLWLGLLLLLADMTLMLLTGVFSAWAALATWGCVDEGFLRWIVGCRGWRLSDDVLEDLVKVAG